MIDQADPLPDGLDVEVYWNLHKRLFSVRDRKTRKVIAHRSSIHLTDVSFHVSEAGRQRVLREQRKNVHATVRGTTGSSDHTGKMSFVRYNPYAYATFVDEHANPITHADAAFLFRGAVWAEEPH